MAQEAIITRTEGRVGIITFNRPEALNALNSALMRETTAALAGFAADPAVAAVVVHGAGRAFSAGFDLKETAAKEIKGSEAWRELLEFDFDFVMQFWDCPKPTIAAVHGYCLAGAFEMALACDMTVAAEGTLFGEPEVRFGAGIVALLAPWITGPKQAKEILLTGNDKIPAERALAMGIVNHVVPAGEELAKALALAGDVAAASGEAVRATKRAVNRGYEMMNMRQALLAGLEADILLESSESEERVQFNKVRKAEGLKAALAWRDARFADGGEG